MRLTQLQRKLRITQLAFYVGIIGVAGLIATAVLQYIAAAWSILVLPAVIGLRHVYHRIQLRRDCIILHRYIHDLKFREWYRREHLNAD